MSRSHMHICIGNAKILSQLVKRLRTINSRNKNPLCENSVHRKKMIQLSLVSVVFAMPIVLLYPTIYMVMARVAINMETDIGSAKTDYRKSPFVSDILNDMCTTLACNQSASLILENMDSSVNPCEDFYTFACGGFLRNTNLSKDRAIINVFTSIHDKVQEQLRTSLEEPILPNGLKAFKIAKIFYKSCVNTTEIERRGLKPLQNVLKKLGGWPVLDGEKWNEADFSWTGSEYKFRKVGYPLGYFIGFSIIPDPKNSTKQMLELDQVSSSPEHEFLVAKLQDGIETSGETNYVTDPFVNAYYYYMRDIAKMLGAPQKASTQQELRQIVQFQQSLLRISLPPEKRRNASLLYNPMTVANLSTQFPSIPWKEYFNNIFASNVTIDDDEIVIVNVPEYISQFEILINNTPKRIQANYAMWRVVEHSIPFLTEKVYNRQLELLKKFSGITQREPRWKRCMGEASIFPSVQSLYIKKYFNARAKNDVVEMVNEIRNQLNRILLTIDWMDNETKHNALDKAAAMSASIAYPDELLDDKKLKETHEEDLEFTDDKYMENLLNLKLFIAEQIFSQYRKPINKTDWLNHIKVAVINAFYNHVENSIEFPAGILQGLMFNENVPKYMNYGAIGSIIGHEITHGFDGQGRQFDRHGNLKTWWTPATDKEYRRKAACIINQYSNYVDESVDKRLNGFNTLDENIADNGGFKLAYLAYKNWSSRNGEESILPGLPFNPQQLFWISAANMWCSKAREEIARYNINYDTHSAAKFRVIGSFSNMDAFSKDFNCPMESRMNPKTKCTLW